jgi:ornithine cyclodeaminase/alanine dehydrogenase-like protein (mu-crystallin family)
LSNGYLRRVLSAAPLMNEIERCLAGVAAGSIAIAPTQHLPGVDGGFHIKSASRSIDPPLAVVKMNGNFPGNRDRFGLPTIQGLVALLDLERGSVLALLDSMALTSLRTAATSAVAARRLARANPSRLAIVGCGLQGRDHLQIFAAAFRLERVALFDARQRVAEELADQARALGLEARTASSVHEATADAELIITATTSTEPWLLDADVPPGAFVAAVGADNPTKVELEPQLVARSVVIVDSLAAAASGGDLRFAIAAGAVTAQHVRAELPQLLAGDAPGRLAPDERILFDSTGLAAADLAAAALAFSLAAQEVEVPRFDFAAS